jgi:hypothetical protein
VLINRTGLVTVSGFEFLVSSNSKLEARDSKVKRKQLRFFNSLKGESYGF